jgi:hypothetical protein
VKVARAEGPTPSVTYHPFMSAEGSPGTLKVMGDGFASLARSPFRTLALLSVLIAVTSTTFGDSPSGEMTALSFVLLAASIYIQIAIILAAGRADPEPSADTWLIGAFRRRCFWRFIGTSLVVVLGLFAGTLLLVVGVFFIGALVGLAQSACVLERRLPMDAINRSAKLANPARLSIGIVFGLLILAPAAATQTVAVAGWADDLGVLWPASLVAGELISAAGTIALTRMFVALGGDATPALDRLAPVKAAPPP